MSTNITFQVGDALATEFLEIAATSEFAIRDDSFDDAVPGELRWQMMVAGSDADAAVELAEQLQRWLNDAILAASRSDQWVTLGVRRGTTGTVYYDVQEGTIRPQIDMRYEDGRKQVLNVELKVLDYPRGEPYDIAESGILVNGFLQFLIEDVPGDELALLGLTIRDESLAGAVNRVYASVQWGRGEWTSTDYSYWLDLAAIVPGASDVVDAASMGGAYASRSVSDPENYVDVAGAVVPDGLLEAGKRDVWAVVYDPATPIAAPTSLTLVDAGYAPSTRNFEAFQSIGVSSSSLNLTWDLPTIQGSTLVAMVRSGTNVEHEMAEPWQKVDEYFETDLKASFWVIENAASRSGVETITYSSSGTSNSFMIGEITNVDLVTPLQQLLRFTGQTGQTQEIDTGVDYDPPEDQPTLLVAAYLPRALAAVDNSWNAPTSGFVEVADLRGYLVAKRTVIGGRVYGTTPAYRTSARKASASAPYLDWMAIFKPQQVTAGGALAAGAYAVRAQALDASGRPGNASATANVTVAWLDGAIVANWTAPATGTVSTYLLTVQAPDGRFYQVETPDDATTFTITSLADALEVSGLPATSGATPTGNRLMLAVGVAGEPPRPVRYDVPVPAANQWRLVRLAGGADVPPVGRLIDGQRPGGELRVQAISGGGSPASVRVDALWLPPSDGAFGAASTYTLSSTTKSLWRLETNRYARRMVAWQEDLVTGDVVAGLSTVNALLLRPGRNLVSIVLEREGGVVDLVNTRARVGFTVHPRFCWQRGAT